MELLPALGRFHPVLNHLPIGMFAAIVLLELYSLCTRDRNTTRKAVTFLWSSCFVACLLTVFCGWQLAREGGYQDRLLFLHRWLSVSFSVLTLLVVILRSTVSQPWAKRVYWALLSVSCGVLVIAGHQGGSMSHGQGYLTKYLFPARTSVAGPVVPDLVAAGLTSDSPAEPEAFEDDMMMSGMDDMSGMNEEESLEGPEAEHAVSYARQIQPIFNRHCVECHGPEKAKEDLRLDSPAGVAKGGEHGAVYVAGKPLESPLFTLVSLPADDLDIMPQKGKPLSKEKIKLIHDWILQGASFGEGVKLEPVTVKPVKKAFSEAAAQAVSGELKAIITNLEKRGVVVRILPGKEGWLSINLSHAGASLPLAEMRPLSAKTAEINLSRTAVSDADLAHLQAFSMLVRLSLKDTAVSDLGLTSLQSLKTLKVLNLSGTEVGDVGIQKLAGLQLLQRLYVWNSQVTSAGIKKLQNQRPDLKIIGAVLDP
jgi:uncharacterized membrane protein/mono/diheme cytochrome c family protein